MTGLYCPVEKAKKTINVRIYHECEGEIEKYVPRITVWHHETYE